MSDRQEAQYTDSVPAMKDLLQSVVPKAMRQAVAKAHVGRWPLMYSKFCFEMGKGMKASCRRSPLQKLVACEELAGVRFRGQGKETSGKTRRGEDCTMIRSCGSRPNREMGKRRRRTCKRRGRLRGNENEAASLRITGVLGGRMRESEQCDVERRCWKKRSGVVVLVVIDQSR
eukprot:764658-Hanusia_phi.AAC.8